MVLLLKNISKKKITTNFIISGSVLANSLEKAKIKKVKRFSGYHITDHLQNYNHCMTNLL